MTTVGIIRRVKVHDPAQPLTTEELERLGNRTAQEGPVSELIMRERRGEV